MRRALGITILLGAAVLSAADAPPPTDAPPPPAKDTPTGKTRLGGGFKGQPVSPGTRPQAAEKPASLPPGARKPPARVTIDNSMVKKNAAPSDTRREPAPPAAAPAPAPAVAMPKVLDLQGHDEAFWRARAAETRDAVRKATSDVAAAEAEEKREENDFYAWDDGQYRDNVIKPAWDRAREEAVKARQNLEAAQKQLDALEDDARRAGAYPGWIRE
jgi:hypothetical protein